MNRHPAKKPVNGSKSTISRSGRRVSRTQRAMKPTHIQNSTETTFPMRVNKYLAFTNHSTRKGGDELVEKGMVFINDRKAVLGDMVQETDRVDVRRKGKQPVYHYMALNKPSGVNTHKESADDTDVLDLVPKEMRVHKFFPIGRLDKASEGLIILTDDGRVTDRLLNPKYDHDKTYEVKVKMPLRTNFKEKMEGGVDIEGYETKPCEVTITGEKSFRVVLTEGKTHQIRRMVAALFNEVVSLKRSRILNIKLGSMPSGGYRIIQGDELSLFLKNLGLI
jgi:23S rRNA pseudouridine2604 synthase